MQAYLYLYLYLHIHRYKEDVNVVLLQAYGAEVQYGAAIKEKSVRALFGLLDDDGDGLLSPLQVRGVWGRGPGVEGEVEGEGGG